jgi:yecA family protein
MGLFQFIFQWYNPVRRKRMTKLAMKQLHNWILTFHNESHSMVYWHGFITSVCCAPDAVMPSRWLNPILHPNDIDEGFSSTNEAQKKMGLLMDLYNEINARVGEDAFEPYVPDGQGDMNQWCRGFLLGLNLWDKSKIEGNRDFFVLILPVLVIVEGAGFFEKNTGFTPEMQEELKATAPELLKSYIPRIRKLFPPH